MRHLEVYIDGCSKGNPGPAGVGVIICEDTEVLKNISSFIGEATNNIAEYTALIYGLQQALILKAEKVNIYSDSELLCRQLNKTYRIKNLNLRGLYGQALELIGAFSEVAVTQIPRSKNKGADKLATKAVSEALKRRPKGGKV